MKNFNKAIYAVGDTNLNLIDYETNKKVRGNAQFIFLFNPKKSSVNVCLMKILKSTVTKNVVVCIYNFCNISNFLNGLFEIHQRFKGQFLNELRVSFKNYLNLSFQKKTLFPS